MKPHPLLLSAAGVVAAQNGTYEHCCDTLIAAGLEDKVFLPLDDTYADRIGSYFSNATQIHPNCVFTPLDVTDVSVAVKALTSADPIACPFAVRSGGHSSIPGAASIDEGVNIDLSYMNSTEYHDCNKTAAVGPGARWGSVYSALDEYGMMVAGGRAASVGVGGLILGGGNSYYASRMGLVCDNVARFEVVLGSGEVVYASAEEHSDLFEVLKGGGNNFGIVTRYDLMAFDGGDLWGGDVAYELSAAPELLQATVDFGNNLENDPYASLIIMEFFSTAVGQPSFVNVFDYTKPVEKPAVFDDLFAIEGLTSDNTRIANMTTLANDQAPPNTQRVDFSTYTTKNDLETLQKSHELYLTMLETLQAQATGEWNCYVLYQPMPTLFADRGAEKGGNVIGLDRYDEPLIMYEPYLAWQGEEQDELFRSQAIWLRNELMAFAEEKGTAVEWLYFDYAAGDQDPLASAGDGNVRKMKAAAEKYDPEGVFQTLVPGGFKISDVELE